MVRRSAIFTHFKKFAVLVVFSLILIYHKSGLLKFDIRKNVIDEDNTILDKSVMFTTTEIVKLAERWKFIQETLQQSFEEKLNRLKLEGHHLENSCKYPILIPEDPSIKHYIKHGKSLQCKQVMPAVVTFNYDSQKLIVNFPEVKKLFGNLSEKFECKFVPFGGTLRPHITKIKYLGDWVNFRRESPKIDVDQFQVSCFLAKAGENGSDISVYRNAIAQVSEKTVDKKTLQKNDEENLSLDIITLDSTSLNMFKRHAPKSWSYMKDVMEFEHLEGYNKVADNSMVNLIPIFLGKRYLNQSEEMLSDIEPEKPNQPLEAEQFDWPWIKFKNKSCATMVNDDPAHYTRGFLHYPWTEFVGYWKKPADYFYRPWHVYHRRWPVKNATKYCFINQPYFELQLQLYEQFARKFNQHCHFSFTFLTEIPHDDPNELELIDPVLKKLLEKLFTTKSLENTVLVVMGDHGNRIASIQYSYVGRIEERASFFSIYFPKWFKKKHPHLIANLKKNRHRFTSNYDVYHMLESIIRGDYSEANNEASKKPAKNPEKSPIKGINLFHEIPSNRNCKEANVPENHCLCMVPVKDAITIITQTSEKQKTLYNKIKLKIQQEIIDRFLEHFTTKCKALLFDGNDGSIFKIENITTWTTNQMIQHGVRYPIEEYMKRLRERFLAGELEFKEIEYSIGPDFRALARFQHDKKPGHFTMTSRPLILRHQCLKWTDSTMFCACLAHLSG